jgi:uncharacterized protein YjbI with pentapeptide repeats
LGWRDIFSYGKDTLSAISNLTDNENFRNNLGRAGGLLSVVSIALDVTEKIYEETQPPKVKAYNRLSKYVLRITKESLKDLKPENDIDTRMIPKQIQISFENASDRFDLINWDSYLPNHPVIIKFKEKIISCLKIADPSGYKEILQRIDSELTRQAPDDPDYQDFNRWWEGQRQFKELIKYLQYVENLNNDKFKIPNNEPLQKYYVGNNLITDINIDTLTLKDDEVRNSFPSQEILKSILERDNDSPLVIAGSFGIGKTSAVKMISAHYASEFLNGSEYSHVPIPIPISLNNPGLKTEDYKFTLDFILHKIIAPGDNAAAKNRPILIIFDALEKYKDTEITIGGKIEQLKLEGFSSIKVILTTSLEEGILASQQINVDKYARMLPFNNAQLDEFFKKYQVMYRGHFLTCLEAIDLGLPVEEMYRPLFAWIFSYLETSSDSKIRIVEKQNWTPKMKKTWMYMLFFHRRIEGKPREAYLDTGWKESYLPEKKLLRAIAALRQLHGLSDEELISSQVVETEIQNFKTQSIDFDISKIEKSYFLFVQRLPTGNWINFVHKSFSDYLLAEYYIESILDNKSFKLNIGIPNKEVIEFLEGLLDLLDTDDNDVEESISSSMTSDKTSLLVSYNYSKGRREATEELISTTSGSVKEECINLLNGNPVKKQEREGMWLKLDSTNTDYKHFWIHRWISLFILNKLIAKYEGDRNRLNSGLKEGLTNLINYSGNLVPSYLKSLRNTDLSGADLSNAILFGADLSGADLSNANLFRADLSGADLSNANLFRADMTDINMSDADLSHANLSFSVLSRANLSDSVFSHTRLSNAKLSYAILSYAILSKSDLSHASLSFANLSDANLSYATILEADLSNANLSAANLTCAIIKGCQKYNNLVCRDADFNAVSIDNKELLECLKTNQPTNIPQAPTIECQDTVPPKLINASPSKDSKSVPTWAYITATFSETMSRDSIDRYSFTLHNKGSLVEGIVSLISPEDKTAVFIPLHSLSTNTNYTAVITNKVKDLFGNRMQSEVNWEFTTAKTTICDRLAILGITANGDDGNIPRHATDNNLNTRWSNLGVGSWIQMDLGEPKKICNLQIAWFKGNRRISDFVITLFNHRKESEKPIKKLDFKSKGDSLLPESYDIGNVEARYVRITVNGNSLNNWASITEISVWGDVLS